MPKSKKNIVNCSVCKKRITVDIPAEAAKNREVYPFEYLHLHGNPRHALMLFVDKNLVVRNVMPYKDTDIAEEQKKQISSIARMSEIEALASIYEEGIRIKIFELLTKGPQRSEALIECIESEGLDAEDFNAIMMPLLKTGIVKSRWLSDSFYDCYFLVEDFIILRTVPDHILSSLVKEENKFFLYKPYEKLIREYFEKYGKRVSTTKGMLEDFIDCFSILKETKYQKIIEDLNKNILSEHDIEGDSKEVLRELIKRNVVAQIPIKGKKYYGLLCNIFVKRFVPEYMFALIANSVKDRTITHEIASKHFDLLYEGAAK